MLSLNLIKESIIFDSLSQFMDKGGPILWWLAILIFIFWLIAIERVLFVTFIFPKRQQYWLEQWKTRDEHQSWYAQKQRDAWLSQAHLSLFKYLHILKFLIALFPMLGLLGTVTGMITVFDTLSVQGTSEPKLMAAGIAMATLPTMAGMVAALAAVFFYSQIFSMMEKKELHLDKLFRSRS